MTSPETRICQNCKASFVIDASDFAFYEKIKVPPPTFCPDCRRQRRVFFRNERALYKRKCDAPGHTEEIISVFSPDKPATVYDDRYWWSDAWDPLDYGREYDFTKPFFEQFKGLLRRVPLINLSITNMANCSYCNVSEGDKDCYLVTASERDEAVMYSNRVISCKDSLDLYVGSKNELCYEVSNSEQCYRTFFSQHCSQCVDSAFLYDCVGCERCFGCSNLRNKTYHFFNEPCTKEEYGRKLAGIDLGSFAAVQKARAEHAASLDKAIRRFARILKSTDSTGDNLAYVKNCKFSFDMVGNPAAEDCKFINWGGAGTKDVYDGGPGIGVALEGGYELTDSGIQSSHLFFTSVVYGSYDAYYSINCHGSRNLFGCYGVRSKEYCILNKQYSKGEYEKLLPRIIEHMDEMPYVDRKGRIYKYGEFFPAEVSLFAYNETIAQEYFPLTKEQAIAQGYVWKGPEGKNYQITKTPDQLPDHIKEVPDTIVNEVIGCLTSSDVRLGRSRSPDPQASGCTTAFKIIPQELQFYRRLSLPLPRLCPNCRHYGRLRQRNPLKLWHRKCMCAGQKSGDGVYANTATHPHGDQPCPNEFQTSYSPERPEIVYCEACYQNEVS